MNRDIFQILCSCHGTVERVPTTDQEEATHGCSRRECCVHAYACKACGVRWVFVLHAPELRED